MKTINISLPKKLKELAEALIKAGYYASMSDLVRSSLRESVKKSKYDLMADEAEAELKAGKGTLLKTEEEIDEFFKNL